jgi:hypothetical protein
MNWTGCQAEFITADVFQERTCMVPGSRGWGVVHLRLPLGWWSYARSLADEEEGKYTTDWSSCGPKVELGRSLELVLPLG